MMTVRRVQALTAVVWWVKTMLMETCCYHLKGSQNKWAVFLRNVGTHLPE